MEQSNGRRLSSPYLLALVALFAMTSFFDVCSGKRTYPPVLDAFVGDNINIQCHAPPPPVKDRKMLMWIKENQLVSWESIKWVNNSNEKYDSEYVLELIDVVLGDAGEYACTMKPGTVARTILKVRPRPVIHVTTFEQTEGTSDEPQKIATCTVINATENDKIAWLRKPEENNYMIWKNENGTIDNITIDYMTTDLSALLNDVPATCTVTIPKFRYATGPAPRVFKAQADLKIKETTTPVPTTKPIAYPYIKKFARQRDEEQVTIMEGWRDVFQCLAGGHPTPETFWSKDGVVIQEAFPKHISRNGLDISDAKLEDAGMYKCTAKSEVGEVSREIRINISAKPRFSRPGTENEPVKVFLPADADEAKLTCEVISNPKSNFTWEVPGAEASDFKTYYKYTPEDYSSVSVARIPHEFFSSDEETKVYCVATCPAGTKKNTLLVKKEPRGLSSAVVAILVVVIIVLFALVLIGTVVVVRKRAASNGQEETVENGCTSALLCGGKKPLESEADGKSEQVNDVVKEEDEELVAGEENEEKQHLTEATDNDTNEQTEVAAEEEKMLESPKKKINLTGSLGCCRRSRKKLQEDEDEDEVTGTDNKNGDAPSADGANANVDGNNEDGEAKNGAGLESITEEKKQPDEDKINDEEFDRDSGKGDTLKPMTEPVGAEDGEVATEVAESK